MKRVTGIGGIFFKSSDPERLRKWYSEHLGIESDAENGAMLPRLNQTPAATGSAH